MMTTSPAPDPHARRVLVLAPFGRDAEIVAQALALADIPSTTAPSGADLVPALQDDPGALLVTEEALTPEHAATLTTALASQPTWSDLPVLLLLAGGERPCPAAARQVAALRLAGNVTVLARPVATLTLVTAVQSALRARQRQYQVRDLLGQERAAREQAETATRLKDEFLATVSHELRTPLAAILIWGNLVATGRVKPQDMPKALQAIEHSAAAQSRMIEDLLDVSRIESGNMRVLLREAQLAPIAEAALEIVQPTATAKHIRLDVTLDPEAGLVLADPERMQQAIWNLLSNALKFTPSGGRVSLLLARSDGHVQVRVADSGIGIAPAFLPHVFERFRQADASSTRQHGGLGLGLAITRQLIELHGGTVVADSQGEGHGAVFTIELPRVAS